MCSCKSRKQVEARREAGVANQKAIQEQRAKRNAERAEAKQKALAGTSK